VNKPIKRLAVLGVAALLLSGCASTNSIPEDHFYRLAPLSPPMPYAEPRLEQQLVVGRVKAYGIYHERAILYIPAGRADTLKYHHYHYWIDKPAVMIREQLIHYLRESRVSAAVSDVSGRHQKGWHLQPMLKRFERQLKSNGDVEVGIELDIKLVPESNGAPPVVRTYSVRHRAEDGSMAASIRAFNSGLLEIYRTITADLSELAGLPESTISQNPYYER